MAPSFSDIPIEALREQLTRCLHVIGDAERLGYEAGVSDSVIQLCQAAMMITQAGHSLLGNDMDDARLRISAAVEQLTHVQSQLQP